MRVWSLRKVPLFFPHMLFILEAISYGTPNTGVEFLQPPPLFVFTYALVKEIQSALFRDG